jgi:hypothetical protein
MKKVPPKMGTAMMKYFPNATAALLLILMGILAGGATRRESITVDEVAHIGAGVSYLQKLDMRMNLEHPPLAKLVAAIPLILRGVHADYSHVSWSFSNRGFGVILGQWVWGHAVALQWNDPYSTVAWARVPMLLLTLALGVYLYRYASELGGRWGGLLCVAAYVSTPAFLVFGPLVLTDIPVALVSLLTMWSFALLWRDPNRRRAVVFGLLLAASFLTKFSSGLLLFCFLSYRLSLRFAPLPEMPADREALRSWRRVRAKYFWQAMLITAVTVYFVYFILSVRQPTDSLEVLGHSTAALLLRRLLMPAWLYLRGLFFFAVMSSRPTFLLGHSYPHGVWFYFPVMFALKSTLAFLLMLVIAVPIGLLARRKAGSGSIIPAEMRFHWRAVWVFLVVFTGFCMLSRMTISIRHFTIPILLIILLLAPIPHAIRRLSQTRFWIARALSATYVLLAVVSIATVSRTYPYYFPFLNSLSFGRPAYHLVNDSNLDWNHALPEVESYVVQHGLADVLVDEYGFNDPAVYVPQSRIWSCQQPLSSDAGHWAFVSADVIEESHNCLWLLRYPHEPLAGGSMYVVRLPETIPAGGTPGGPPAETDLHAMFGMEMPGFPETRSTFLQCIKDPNQLQPTMDKMMALFAEEQAKRTARRGQL